MNTSGEFIFDPTFAELATARLDLTIAGTMDAITMVESQANEVSEATMLRALAYAHGLVQELCQAQLEFVAKYRLSHAIPEFSLSLAEYDLVLAAKVLELVTNERITPLFHTGKTEFYERLSELEDTVLTDLGYDADSPENTINRAEVVEAVYSAVKSHMRASVLHKKVRLDGRAPNEVRPLRSTVGILPRTHGSGLFERGVTQVLSVTTLG